MPVLCPTVLWESRCVCGAGGTGDVQNLSFKEVFSTYTLESTLHSHTLLRK